MIDWNSCPAVELNPELVSGAWVFRGTRVPVVALFKRLSLAAQSMDWDAGAAALAAIRTWVSVNLGLGVLIVALVTLLG